MRFYQVCRQLLEKVDEEEIDSDFIDTQHPDLYELNDLYDTGIDPLILHRIKDQPSLVSHANIKAYKQGDEDDKNRHLDYVYGPHTAANSMNSFYRDVLNICLKHRIHLL